MARTDRFYIGLMGETTGLDSSLKPFAIPDNAFQSLENAYVFRGRIRKRFGSYLLNGSVDDEVAQLSSRVRINIGTTDGTTGDFTGFIPTTATSVLITQPAIGQMFSIGNEIFTVNALGTPANLLVSGNLIDNTDGFGDASSTVPGSVGAIGEKFIIGSQVFTVTVTNGALTTTGPATGTFNTSTGDYTFTGADIDTPIYWFSVTSATFNTTTGQVSFTRAQLDADVYFYPALPIIGIVNYFDGLLDSEPFFVFDTNYVYQFSNNAFTRSSTESQPGASVWSGSDSQLMWGYTNRGISQADYYVFVSNFKPSDRLRYFDQSNWNFFSPVLNSTNRLLTSRIVLPFKDRLICLNTVENAEGTQVATSEGSGGMHSPGYFQFLINPYVFTWGQIVVVGTTTYLINQVAGPLYTVTIQSAATGINPPAITATFTVLAGVGTFTSTGDTYNPNLPVYYLPNSGGSQSSFVNRCRFSQNGSPVSINAFEDSVAGLGGFVDASTKEQIVTAEFLKDRLIVYFESSTWELVYTGNEILPFRWQQLNTELGAQSTFSIVPFDKVAIGIGNVGIHACNGSNVERIDDKIPDEVFSISTDNQGVFRVYGIRDYFTELIYWSFPSEETNSPFPNRVLVYNYKTGSWAFNDDSITAFGYYQEQDDLTWESTNLTWEEFDAPWSSPENNANFRQIIAGNQEGFVFVVDPKRTTRNAPALQITNIQQSGSLITITAMNHNLEAVNAIESPDGGDYVAIESAQGVSGINGKIYAVDYLIDNNSFVIVEPDFDGTYIGGGTIARVSNYNIVTKQYNFYASQGRNCAINKVDFLVDATSDGQVTVDYSVGSSRASILANAITLGSAIGNGVLSTVPYALSQAEQSQDRLWHPIYPMAEGECIQLEIYMNDNVDLSLSQIRNPLIAWSDLTIHALVFYATPTSSRFN